jgi:hypothetical protein
VQWNRNSAKEFQKHTGKKLASFSSGKVSFFEIRCFVWLAAVEGERADGKKLELTEEEFCCLFGFDSAIEFSKAIINIVISKN